MRIEMKKNIERDTNENKNKICDYDVSSYGNYICCDYCICTLPSQSGHDTSWLIAPLVNFLEFHFRSHWVHDLLHFAQEDDLCLR